MFLYDFAKTFEVVYVSAITFLHGENGFAEISKNLARYKFENNFNILRK